MEKNIEISLTKRIATTAILLSICIASQVFKNLSVYITGPIVNLCLVLAVLTAGVIWATALAVITPVTAFFIASSPVMSAVPGIIPLIMLGNVVLVLMVHFFFRPSISDDKLISVRSAAMALLSSLAKGCVMGLTISLWLLPTFIPQASPLREKMPVFQKMFSLVQFITALIGFVYFFIVWKPVCKMMKNEQ